MNTSFCLCLLPCLVGGTELALPEPVRPTLVLPAPIVVQQEPRREVIQLSPVRQQWPPVVNQYYPYPMQPYPPVYAPSFYGGFGGGGFGGGSCGPGG